MVESENAPNPFADVMSPNEIDECARSVLRAHGPTASAYFEMQAEAAETDTERRNWAEIMARYVQLIEEAIGVQGSPCSQGARDN